jgi:hypothetical protein
MSRKVTYRLPPYVKTAVNPHYISNGEINYAPYKLVSMGNYPLGIYHVNSINSFGGSYQAVDSTNTSVTLQYNNNPGTYPDKTPHDTVLDINTFQFAYKPYDHPRGLTYININERLYDPLIYDYDAYKGQDTVEFNQIEISTKIYYTIGQIPNQFSDRYPVEKYKAGDTFRNSVMSIYGYAVVYLPDLPGVTDEKFQDPTGLNIVERADLDKIKGRYLIVIADRQGFGERFRYDIYPPLPVSSNASIRIEPIGIQPPDIIESERLSSGVDVIITYDSLYKAQTGPGNSIVFPYNNELPSSTQPLTITPPVEAQATAFRFYMPGSAPVPFDLYRALPIAPRGELMPNNVLPANLIGITVR